MKLNKTSFQLQFKRGLDTNINTTPTKSLAIEGEPHWTTDEKELWIFDGTQNVRILTANSEDVYTLPTATNTSPAAGHLWFDGSAIHFRPASDTRSVNLSNGVIVADTTVANTTTETTIFTESVSANELFKGSKWHVKTSGHYSTANAADRFTMRMKIGGTTVHSFTSTAENVTNGLFRTEWFFTVRSTGASGTLMSTVEGIFNTTLENDPSTSVDTVDTTTSEDLTITIQWDNALAGNTLTITQGSTEIMGVKQT